MLVLKPEVTQKILFSVGINHKTAPIEVREKICLQDEEIPALISKLRETVTECVVLATCNRTEIYAVTTRTDLDLDFYKDLLIDFKNAHESVNRNDLYGLISCTACQQLLHVATSIDSKIIGDTQILGQLRDAYALAKEHDATGKILNQLFQHGFKIGKQTKTETNLHKGAISTSLAAVELAVEHHKNLKDKTVLIIGAGETAKLVAECLMQRHIEKLLITNRTKKHADEMLEHLRENHEFEGETIDFKEFRNRLDEADIIISSTGSSDAILTTKDFPKRDKKLLLIDIAMPRDIAPEVGELENISLKNIDDLNNVINSNFERRMESVPLVNRMIHQEMNEFLVWYYSLPLLPEINRHGEKPSKELQEEIVSVKKFLLSNASKLHKMAMQRGAESFKGHISVVNELSSMKKSETQNQKRAKVGA